MKSKWRGYTALVLACLFGIFAVRNGISLARQVAHGEYPPFGHVIGHLLRTAVVCYCALIAHRHLSSRPISSSPWRSVGWARVFTGLILLVAAIHSVVNPHFHPSNDAEAFGAMLVKIVLVPGLGIALVIWGVARGFYRTQKQGVP